MFDINGTDPSIFHTVRTASDLTPRSFFFAVARNAALGRPILVG